MQTDQKSELICKCYDKITAGTLIPLDTLNPPTCAKCHLPFGGMLLSRSDCLALGEKIPPTKKNSELADFISLKLSQLLVNDEPDNLGIRKSDTIAGSLLLKGYIKKSEIRVDEIELERIILKHIGNTFDRTGLREDLKLNLTKIIK